MSYKLESLFHSLLVTLDKMEFEKDKDTKECDDDENDEKVKSSENVSIKEAESSEKLPLSDEEEDDEDDDKNNSDSKSSSAPGTDDKKKKP